MKYLGKTIDRPQPEIVVIPRPSGNIIIRCAMVTDFTAFDGLCPEPKPPKILLAGETEFKDNYEDPEYTKAMNDFNLKRASWLVIKSLTLGTPELEFETVKLEDPSTWANYAKELEDDGLTKGEIQYLITKAIEACGFSTSKVEEATKDFLATQRKLASK